MATRIIPLLTQQKNHTMQAPPSYQSLLQKISDLENKNSILECKLDQHNKCSNIQQCTNPTSNLLRSSIHQQYIKALERNIWGNSPFQLISNVECDDVGRIGENVMQKICDECNIPASINGTLTKSIGGGKIGDGTIKGRSVEIKTARQGTAESEPYQHEMGEKPWIAEFTCFVDIGPEEWWIHLLPNYTEEFYRKSAADKTVKCIEWGFPKRSICQRKGVGAFKLDTTKKINETASKNSSYTFCVTHPEGDETLAQFINRIIPDE